MTWRTIPELGPCRQGIFAAATDSDDSGREDVLINRGGGKGGKGGTAHLPCPFPLCDRHEKAFTRGFRWREHLGRKHKLTKARIEALEDEAKASAAMLGVNVIHRAHAKAKARASTNFRQQVLDNNPQCWLPPDPLVCSWCTKGNVHPRVSRLLDHIRRRHKFDPRVDPIPKDDRDLTDTGTAIGDKKESRRRDESEEESEEEDGIDEESVDEEAEDMLGGVHVDGFMQPVLFKKGRGRDRSQRLHREKSSRSEEEVKAAKRKRSLHEEDDDTSRQGKQ